MTSYEKVLEVLTYERNKPNQVDSALVASQVSEVFSMFLDLTEENQLHLQATQLKNCNATTTLGLIKTRLMSSRHFTALVSPRSANVNNSGPFFLHTPYLNFER